MASPHRPTEREYTTNASSMSRTRVERVVAKVERGTYAGRAGGSASIPCCTASSSARPWNLCRHNRHRNAGHVNKQGDHALSYRASGSRIYSQASQKADSSRLNESVVRCLCACDEGMEGFTTDEMGGRGRRERGLRIRARQPPG